MGKESKKPGSSKLVIGLIGGIGSGKSYVAQLLRSYGGHVVEGDRLGHEALHQPAIRDRIVQRWGRDLLTAQGEIDRKRLAAIVFADPQERQALEALVHPYIAQRLREEIAKAQADPSVRFVVVDAALLLEASWGRFCDYIVYVEAAEELRRQRTLASRGWSVAEWQAREAAQWPVEKKRLAADAVLDNSGDIDRLHTQIASLLRNWLGE